MSFALHAPKPRPSPFRRLLDAILGNVGLKQPDGRALFRYRLTDQQYARCGDILRKAGPVLCAANPNACAVMVIFGSEWFRREATSMARKWERLGVIPDDVEIPERNEMALSGLRFWGIPCRKGVNGSNEYLLTLALNGGLPAHALTSERSRPVVAFFRDVMAAALAAEEQSPEMLERIVQSSARHLPDTFRDPVIFELTSALVNELLKCRSQLPEGRMLSDPAAMLDEIDPQWRIRVPIHLPEDTKACSRLFNDLLMLQPRATGPSVGVDRVLERDADGNWVPGMRVRADGLVQAPELARKGESRYRAFFAGPAGRRISREFARLYVHKPDGEQNYVVEAKTVGRAHTISPYPFDEPLVVQLIQDGSVPFSMAWPGGRSTQADVHVLAAMQSADSLVLVGTSSTCSKFEELFVYTKANATVEPGDGASAELHWTDDTRSLWRIKGAVIVRLVEGERFYVVSGSYEEDRRLIINEGFFPGVEFVDRTLVPCYRPLDIKIEENSVRRSPQHGMMSCSQAGRPLSDVSKAEGVVTVRWLDDAGFLIDSGKLVILPTNALIGGRLSDRGAVVEWSGLNGWTLRRVGASVCSASNGEGRLEIARGSDPTARQPVELIAPNGRSTDLIVDLRCDRLTLVGADGRVVTRSPTISLPHLRGMTLRSDKREAIHLQLIGGGVTAHAMRIVEGTLPAESLFDIIAMLLGFSIERGPSVLITAIDGRKLLHIQRPQQQPKCRSEAGARVTEIEFPKLDSLSTPVARTLISADRELPLEPLHAARCYALPQDVVGPCLVYAREGDAVTCRPIVVDGPGVTAEALKELLGLQTCALHSDAGQRKSLIIAEFDKLADEANAGSTITALLRTVVSLNGLSPRALDRTRWLKHSPVLLCRVLLSASPEDIDIVLDLQRDLPFLWMAQPAKAWMSAVGAEFERAIYELIPMFGESRARTEAASDLVRRLDTLVERSPWFAAIKEAAGFPIAEGPGLHTIAQKHVLDHADLPHPPPSLIVREADRLGVPPAIGRFNYHRHSTLAAPVVLAGIALGKTELKPSLQWALRIALDADPDYVALAFPHCFKRDS